MRMFLLCTGPSALAGHCRALGNVYARGSCAHPSYQHVLFPQPASSGGNHHAFSMPMPKACSVCAFLSHPVLAWQKPAEVSISSILCVTPGGKGDCKTQPDRRAHRHCSESGACAGVAAEACRAHGVMCPHDAEWLFRTCPLGPHWRLL